MFIPPRLPSSICFRCLFQLSARRSISTTHVFRTSVEPVSLRVRAPPPQLPARPIKWRAEYFLSNSLFACDGGGSRKGSKDSAKPPETPQSLLPHRRRQQQLRSKPKPALHPSPTATTTTTAAAAGIDPATQIPPDASSLLSTTSLSLPRSSPRRRLYAYLALCKPRLTALIVLSAMASYALFPVDPLLSEVPTLSALTLTFLTAGTALSAASANAFNMYLEPAYDGLMSRTRNRPLVRGLLTSRQALLFAVASGALGVGSLYIGVNPTVAGLGLLNIALYAGVYTPLKRISVINTWVGAIVGGIPPLMGWAAAAGNFQTTDATPLSTLSHPGGWLLAALLFAWQFPHFTALSWGIREEYRRAGHQMMAWKHPGMNARVALRYSLLFFPICAALCACGVTDVAFLATSSLVNSWLVKEAWRFWKDAGERGSAKRLFWASVWHLPVVMGLAMIHKAGLWKGVYESVVGHDDDDEGGEDGG